MRRAQGKLLTVRCLTVTVFVCLLCGADWAGKDRTWDFEIPRQDVNLALTTLAKQTGAQLLFPYDEVSSQQANPLHGRFTVNQALEIMLRGTGLSGDVTGSGVITISARPVQTSEGSEMQYVEKEKEKGILAAMAAAVLSVFGPHDAAGQQSGQSEPQAIEEIVVTGSRIVRRDIEAVSPVHVVSDAEIAGRGYTRIEEILAHVPQLETSRSDIGRTFVNLRGLGAVRTLVLINGRRLHPGGYGNWAGANAADPSLIPSGLIKNVEILTGGASSVYGADAVAGVVNFILDKDFEGMEVSAGVSGFQHDNDNGMLPPLLDARGEDFYAKGNSFDGFQYKLDVMAGGKFDSGRGHIAAYLGWEESEELGMRDRDYTSCALGSDGSCSGSFTAPQPNFYFPDLGLDATLQDDGSITPWDGNLSNWGNLLAIRNPTSRVRGGAFVNYDLNDAVKPYFELNFMRSESRLTWDESGTFGLPVELGCSTPLLSAEQQDTICGPDGLNLGPDDTFTVNIYKRNAEGGARTWDSTYNSYRAVLGVQGDISDSWRYDASFLYGTTISSELGGNVFSRPRTINALTVTTDGGGNVVCVSGGDCAPYFVFTPGAITQESLDYIMTDQLIQGRASQYVANAYVAGDLPISLPTVESPVAFVFGTEYRKETSETTFDDALSTGQILGHTQQASSEGSYNVTEVFTEAVIPLLEDRAFANSLSAELGYRYSDYSVSGGQSTWKVGLNYRPADALKLRGGFNRAVRAPNVNELFRPQAFGLWNGADPCAGASPDFTQEQCARTGVAASRYGLVSADPVGQFNMILGGNPDLGPETADTYTTGFVMSPLDHLNVSVDYWDIEIDDVIGVVDPQTALNQCALTGEPTLCALIDRAPDGNLWLDLQSGAGGYIQATNANLGRWHFRGVDLSLDYYMPLGSGELQLGLMGSRFLERFYENVKGVAGSRYTCEGLYSSNCDFPTPEWRHNFEATYVPDSFWTASVNWRYYGAVDNPDVSEGIDAGIGAQNYFDVGGTFRLGDTWRIVTGINNVLDKEPPLVSLNISTNYFNTVDGYYDMLGRFMHATVTAKF